MAQRSDYYVYVYIDPRSFEEFYYGKGCGGRKDRALEEESEKAMARRIRAIRKANEEPIRRVIAKGLTERESLLVETALIWNNRRNLVNQRDGDCSKNHFRPQDSMHATLPEYDFGNNIWYVNVAEGEWRSWPDCIRFGFLSAGAGRNWSKQLDKLNPGDIVVAYLKRNSKGGGYAGVGVVTSRAVPVRKFRFRGNPIPEVAVRKSSPLLYHGADDPEGASYLAGIKWVKTFPRAQAKFKPNAGLYAPQRVVASLANQPKTRRFVEDTFGLSLEKLATAAAVKQPH